ncbi:MAG: SH3 domain-containing protein [Lachnospiraceae bacterium]|nr:SH3 domain-containing protein [Lachnospiraceae bacterium]
MRENRRNRIKHIAVSIALLLCMVMSIGMVCFADEQGTVSVKSARIRASADPNSEQLGSVAQGKTVDIIGKTTGTDGQVWYQVYVDANTKGYIRGNLVKLKDGASLKTVDGSAGSAGTDNSASASAPTSTDAKKAAVINKANIRKEASTNGDLVGTANRGTILTVQGETTGSDNMKWYQVSFTYQDKEVSGYVRSDLVTFDNVPADSVSSEISGEVNPDEQQPEDTVPDEQQPAEQPEPAPQPSSFQPINVEEEPPYVMQGFKEFKFTLPNDEQEYKGYQNEAGFIICYAQLPTGEQGWALVNIEMGICQPYVYAMDGIAIPAQVPGGLVSIIVLVVIIIILVAVIGLLLLKSRERGVSYKGYDDDDDEDSEDDIEDLEEMEEEPQPVRRPQSAGPQPVRRPQGGAAGGPQPMRRPQPGPAGSGMPQGQPVRHPQGGAAPQPMRRPQPGPAPQEPQPARRPQPGAGPSGSGARPQPGAGPQPVRRPQGAPQPARRPQPGAGPQPGQGYKAKNLLDDEDMDFMDIE